MNIKEYFGKLNKKSQSIFCETLENDVQLAKVHHLNNGFYEFSKHITDSEEQHLLRVVCSQMESSCLTLSFGLYRQALISLRTSFELGLGAIYFSVNKLEHKEWLSGRGDINWSKIIDSDNGVLSKRFANAFFPELAEEIAKYNCRAKTVYRTLSEYVHGNCDTWKKSGIALSKNTGLMSKYFECFFEASEVLLFSACCRYLKDFNKEQLEEVQTTCEELSHVAPIRELLGGPEDIK